MESIHLKNFSDSLFNNDMNWGRMLARNFWSKRKPYPLFVEDSK